MVEVSTIPNLKSEVHNKFVADQKERQKQLAEAQEELSRLEADGDGLDSDVSSVLSSVDDALDDGSDLPGIIHSRSMSATPAPSSPSILEEGDKLEGLSGATAALLAGPATGTEVPGIQSEQSALLANSGTESVDAGLSQLSPRPTLPTIPEATRATPPGSVDVTSTQTSESSTNIPPAFTPNANDVDMVDATQEPSMEIKAVTGRVVPEKAQSEFDVEMSDGTRAITEGEGIEMNRAEGAVREVEELDAQKAPAVPAVGVSKAPAQMLPAHSDVEMTDREVEASVTATGEGEAAISASVSIQEGGALAETHTALKKGETQKAPAIPAVGASKASVGILPAHSDAEMMDGGVEASATATGEGEGETSVSTSGSTRTALKEKVETQEAPAIPAVGDSEVPVQALPSTDVEMADGRVEASPAGGLVKNQTTLKEGDKIQEAPIMPAVGEQKTIAQVQPDKTTVEMLDVCTVEVTGVAANREREPAQPPSKEEIGEAVVGDDVTGHDSVLIRMDPEEEIEQGKGMSARAKILE